MKDAYNSKTVFGLVLAFTLLFWLLYGLGTFFHKTAKIRGEIELIRDENAKIEQKILEKERYLLYLRTTERVDKEAKIQLGRRQEGEEVLVFLEEKLDLLPTEEIIYKAKKEQENMTNLDRWRKLLFGS